MELLVASTPADAAAWRSLIERLPADMRDLHYLPGYVDVYARKRGGKALCAVHEDASGFALYPYVELGSHIACAYGYGGPLASDGYADCAAFAIDFADMMRRNGIRSEFCRLHPLLMERQRPLALLARLAYEKPVVSVDLTGLFERDMRKGHRSAAVKAAHNGAIVWPDSNFDTFLQIHTAAMARKRADQKWLVDVAFLNDLRDAVYGAHAMVASYNGEPQAACLLLSGFGTCYYHYAANTGEHLDAGIGHLLVLQAMRYARGTIGCRQFYMGGGLTTYPDDPLLRFKQGFTRDGRRSLYKYERTF